MRDLFPEFSDDDHEFYLECELLQDLPNGYLEEFKARLEAHPDSITLKKYFIINLEKNTLVYILNKIYLSEVEGLTKEQHSFYPLCSKDEIERIFNVKTADDFLLKYRAEQIVDNMRLKRVFNTIRKKKKNWNFTNYFKTDLFSIYLSWLPNKEKDKCANVSFGTIYLKEANGYCMKTEYGDIIVISYALKYFLYYMNLFHFGSQMGIKEIDTFNSYIIAVNTMLGTEALDFEIDSRGKIPTKANKEINAFTNWQLFFIIGHEIAHHCLDHLKHSKVGHLKSHDNRIDNATFYNYKQKMELEADYFAIILPNVSNRQRTELADSAFLFFIWLDLYETVENYFFPPISKIKSHPNPLDRLWELRKRLDEKIGMSSKQLSEQIDYYSGFKNDLRENYLPFNVDSFEIYGSRYLPSYKGEITEDRLHF